MKRLLVLAVALLALGLLLAGCGGEEKKAEQVLKIGTMSPLTGPYAADGNDIRQGAEIAVEVVNEAGGIPGFSKIEIVSEDTACDPKQAVAAANKLINEKVPAVVGAYCSSSTIPASETLAEENIFMLTPASTNPKVTERGLKYMFRTCGRDDHQAPAAVKFMKDVEGVKTIFIVDDKTTYSQGLAEGVAAAAEAVGIQVLEHDHVNQGDKDYSAVLTKVKAANPDLFYISLQNSATGALMVIQAKRMGIDAILMGQDAVYHPKLIEIAKGDSEGMFCTFGAIDKDAPKYKEFQSKYKAKTGNEPGAYSAYAFDSATAYLTAVKAAGTTEPAKVREELLKLDFTGASKQINYQENGDSGSNYTVYKIQDGKFVPYWNSLTGEKL
ncbi:Leucine-, isoleucine-, valine-, threonine-, and alanine-binding protein precursor [Pseudodesulfovibrio hydrargyri]|uniref:Leucine-, isoleucine-, valine-, threonine-, and alanine-binding protein n=1 Tax=Pseudodesulfovibrio hydrargyri TaxID=2125990 RepID=A0A1J5ND30_9BACT|nr:branched-chain amino acid ABC transporter substrate-binding protein [Pseudodesulfovibrio hydrargyri]OIQ49625.1 Leucine-, isoleucine-, valine-, threonine-, and alanine-binding protein precursor [Pseudodesulfovibrio hydrargyri]